jgi:serine/threonine kinase PknH
MDAAGDCYISELPNRESWGMNMRQLTVALALASACIFIASCSSRPSPPVAVDALDGLLLSPAEMNTAIGATGILLNGTTSAVMSDNSANIPDKDCRFNLPVQASVYDGSGWIATRGQFLSDSSHGIWQAVVSFPSANQAARFFSASAQRWEACPMHQFHYINPGQPDKVFTVGPIAITNGTLSTTNTQVGAGGFACQRALAVSNNVAIDVAVCSVNPAHAAVFNIADQIAAKVAKL